jgi:hypothetical protein
MKVARVLELALLAGLSASALGQWLGLRELQQGMARLESELSSSEPSERTLPAANPASPPAEAANAQDAHADRMLHLRDAVLSQFAEQHQAYVEACYRPSQRQAGQGQPDLGAVFEVIISLGADGHETARRFKVSQTGEEYLPCVQSLEAPKLKVPPPGQPSEVTGSLLLP